VEIRRFVTLYALRQRVKIEEGSMLRTVGAAWKVKRVFPDSVVACSVGEDGRVSETEVFFYNNSMVLAPEGWV
jgi:hypothetical protein